MAGLAVLAALSLDRLYPPNLSRLSQQSTLVEAEDGTVLRAFAAPDGAWRYPIDAAKIDGKFRRFLIAYEDQRFGHHPGVDPLAMLRAVGQAIKAGHVVSGASTLTMQTVRLLEPRPRTAGAKLIEMARALQLQWHFGSERILGIYMTLAPYGGNLEGIRAASLAYFGKEPAHLTDAEAALLVALPQSPERLRPDRYPAAARAGRDKVLNRLRSVGMIDTAAVTAALAEAVPSQRQPALIDAPHLAQRLLQETPDAGIIATTLDGDLQRRLQLLVARHQRQLEPAASIAVLVIENAGRKARAYIGSSDFFADQRFGQNDMVRAIRSPGSALKPFIYGMGFDDLLVHPESVMQDVATRFGDYAPQNFDNLFRGDLTAREALQTSRNLPAVALLDRVGPARFRQHLQDVGVTLQLPPQASAPGLPIALGGVGISLEDLVTLYAGIADQGAVAPLVFRSGPEEMQPAVKTLMSPMAAYYLTQILNDTPPPPNRLAGSNRRDASQIAYKTGTSYGYRDAWAIGYNARFTIGVWVGRPDGSFSPDRMGRDTAAPILFEAFDQLPASPSALPATVPAGVILSDTLGLPANLRRFQSRTMQVSGNAPQRDSLGLQFPVDGSTLDLGAVAGNIKPLVLRATGGAMPLRWLVNGQPVPALPYRRQTEWQPDGRGATRITVIDNTGASASAAIWLQ
ncbi:MAG: penicillin-binding protein 1C [Dongiaceae bacterium]